MPANKRQVIPIILLCFVCSLNEKTIVHGYEVFNTTHGLTCWDNLASEEDQGLM